jgi:hypothetical protein
MGFVGIVFRVEVDVLPLVCTSFAKGIAGGCRWIITARKDSRRRVKDGICADRYRSNECQREGFCERHIGKKKGKSGLCVSVFLRKEEAHFGDVGLKLKAIVGFLSMLPMSSTLPNIWKGTGLHVHLRTPTLLAVIHEWRP